LDFLLFNCGGVAGGLLEFVPHPFLIVESFEAGWVDGTGQNPALNIRQAAEEPRRVISDEN
jgi:hypothetical protein